MTGIPVPAAKLHVAINVTSLERSIEFYRKLFGIEPAKIHEGYAKFDVANPPLNFTLNERLFDSAGALSHLGIQVESTEDVLKVRRQWLESGLLTRDEMNTSCCYAVQDKTWVHDPDGNEWEVFTVLQDNLPETVSSLRCCAPVKTAAESCCATAEEGACCVEP